ncbi:MAG: DUF4253 domain-containing protein [Solirubrobacteraceae bacterium]
MVENPFAVLERNWQQVQSDDPGPYQLLLVPCNQPADAIDVLDFGVAGIPPGGPSALLRSWEARFGADLVMLSPNGRELLAVQSPPTSPGQAQRLAIEILAATGAQNNITQTPGPLSAGLRGARISLNQRFDPPITTTSSSWGFLLGDT